MKARAALYAAALIVVCSAAAIAQIGTAPTGSPIDDLRRFYRLPASIGQMSDAQYAYHAALCDAQRRIANDVEGFTAGPDGYLSRTFKPGELTARDWRHIRAAFAEAGLSLPGAAPVATPAALEVPAKVFAQAPNVVRVRGHQGIASSWGSGTYLGHGLVLTAEHVVDEASAWTVYFADGHESTATVLAADASWDCAIVELATVHPTAAGVELAPANPGRGELVTVAGYDGGRDKLLWRPGLVTRFYTNGRESAGDWFEVDNAVRGGSSGGPAFDQTGRLIGNLWGSDGRNTMALTTGRVRRFLLPWNARLEAWRMYLAAGHKPTQICQGGYCYSPPSASSRPTYPTPTPPTAPPTSPPVAPPIAPPVAPQPLQISLAVGDVQTLPAGSDATVALRQAGDLVYLDFGIPRGADGSDGSDGRNGSDGAPGPAGPAGPIGPAGDAAAVNLDDLAQKVKDQIKGSMRVRIEPVKK